MTPHHPSHGLTDPQALEAQRHALEVTLTAAGLRGLREFLSKTQAEALASWTSSGVLLAAGLPSRESGPRAFTLGKVSTLWGSTVARRMLGAVKAAHGVPESQEVSYDPVLAPLARALSNAPVVGRVYDAARDALLTNPTAQRAAVARDLTRALDTVKWEPGIRSMARQSATASHNARTVAALARAGFPTKRWVSMHDEHTRPTHRQADGQERALDAAFIVGGYALQVPGDPTAPLAETRGCRCVVVGVSGS